MSADQNGLARLRSQARQARTEGQFRQAARFERQAVELAQALGLASERVQALLWEGYSLRQAGEEDLALAALLQAASERATTADPADVFAALVAVIHISLERKLPAFCRALLDEGRRYLTDLRQPWNGLLDYLEGELAYREGHWAVAWEWYCRAWAGRRTAHPCLTAATHLGAVPNCLSAARPGRTGTVDCPAERTHAKRCPGSTIAAASAIVGLAGTSRRWCSLCRCGNRCAGSGDRAGVAR